MELSKHLVLVDDAIIAFWKDGDAWSSSTWDGYTVHTLDRNDVGGLEEIIDKLVELAQSGSLYIVTDGNLWLDTEGGSTLLDRARSMDQFQRGVVYSSEPLLSEELTNAENVFALTREMVEDKVRQLEIVAAEVRQIKEFFETGRKPATYVANEKARQLSSAIHRLENLALPLRLDIETLQSSGTNDETVLEMFSDYFNTDDPLGFLSRGRLFPNEHIGLEGEVVDILKSVQGAEGVNRTTLLDLFRVNGEPSPAKVCSAWSLDAIRNDAVANRSDREWLRETLNQIAARIVELAEQVRHVRKAAGEPGNT